MAEVRTCAQGDDHGTTTPAGRPVANEPVDAAPTAPSPGRPTRTADAARAPRRSQAPPATRAPQPVAGIEPTGRPDAAAMAAAIDLAGPSVLGRSLLIRPDGPVPEPWGEAPQVEADASSGPEIVDRLHQAWRERERLVIRWTGPLPTADSVSNEAFHQLGPDHELPGERLRFAVTANSVDLRGSSADLEPLRLAQELGATPMAPSNPTAPTTMVSDNGPAADVVLADGATATVDGGPLDLDLPGLVGGPVIPRVHLVSGSLRPLQVRRAPAADLAPDQLEAVGHRTGPARILAPAGSGKTRVLTERTRHLVNDCGLTARSICMVAYNRRAKDEVRDRLADVAALDIRTLNSLALALATGSGPFRARGPDRGRGPATIDELEARRILDRVLPGRRRRKLTDPLEPWIDALSACRLGLRDPAEIEQAYGGDVAGFPEILEQYRSELERRNALDFDEQIIRAIDRLATDPQARRIARSVAPILLVDEFQDLTPAHLLLLRLLAGPAGEIFAVGDDDQTIYGYAGASPDWLIHFGRFFPGAHDHRLTVNYRCPAGVVEAAVNLLSHNRHRVAKEIHPGPGAESEGLAVLSIGDPQRNLVDHVRSLIDKGAAPDEVAVLARVNAALLPPAIHLHHAGIAVVRPWGMGPEMLDRSGVGAALAWLRLATGPAQGFAGDDIRLALRRPPRSLHPRVADWTCEQRSVSQLEALAQRLTKEREAETVASFASDIERLRSAVEDGANTEDLFEMVYEQVGLLGAASQLDTSQRSARRAAHADELAALTAVAGLHDDPSTFEDWLRAELAAIPRFDPERPVAGVTLATVHTTKGLEWPHVVVHDARGDLYPHRLATDTEEERRIFHVALTRGRRSVVVTVSGPPSPFAAELATARPRDRPWPNEPATDQSIGRVTSSGKAGRPPKPERSEPSGPREAALRDSLVEWRRERSKADGVPAYVVFDNKTLDAIARVEPSSLGELGAISGIGPAKLERYGADVLGLVASIDD